MDNTRKIVKTSGLYDAIVSDFPSSISSRYYDSIILTPLLGVGSTTTHEHEITDENLVLSKWGFSVFEFTTPPDTYKEVSFALWNKINVTLRYGSAGIPGYTGRTYPLNSWLDLSLIGAAVQYTATVLNPDWLTNLSFPISQTGNNIYVDFRNTGYTPTAGTSYLMTRVIGKYTTA